MELLSPAGSFKGFIGAVNAGCNAVYLGGNKYGARAYAENFTDEEIIKAIRIAHVFDVKVYLTVNTLIKEREFDDVIEYITPFYEVGLDACIVQDIGLISMFNTLFPNMECHISTQAYSTGLESVKFYKSLGASRVVLARELSLEEIKQIKKSEDIEIETFIHGAMCYSYSGQCLFSSCLGGRSGNRGRCAGPCRQEYSYISSDGKEKSSYFLSMKDQCTLEILPLLIEAGIDSLKIEGRMKKPEYTAFVTSIYRKYIDLYYKNPTDYRVDSNDLYALKNMYLRSEINDGYYLKQNGREMLTLSRPSYNGNSESLMQYTYENYIDSFPKKKIKCYFSAIQNNNFSVTYYDDNHFASYEGNVVDKASNRPICAEDIKKQLSKLGDTCFEIDEIDGEVSDGIFVQIKELNEARRNAVESLYDTFNKKRTDKMLKSDTIILNSADSIDYPIVYIHTYDQYTSVKECNLDRYLIAIPYEMIIKYNIPSENILIVLPDVVRSKDYKSLIDFIKKQVNFCYGFYIRNYDSLNILIRLEISKPIISGPELYCFNNFSKNRLMHYCNCNVAPYELSKHELKELNLNNTYIQVYGKIPLVHSANCVVKTMEHCKARNNEDFVYIKDKMNAKFPVYRNCLMCSNIIYNCVPVVLWDEFKKLDIDQNHFIVCFTDETSAETKNIIECIFNSGNVKINNFTKAYFKKGIE